MEIQMEAVEDPSISAREASLEAELAEAHATIAAMKAAARKTTAPIAGTLLAKEGPAFGLGIDLAALDAAMSCLSIEQRIAVKAGLLRAGYHG